MSIKLEDFLNCCRCCLSTTPPFHPLFGLYLLSDMLNDISSLNVIVNDGYPQQVCRRCVIKIGTSSTFKNMVLKSHQIFTDLIKESRVTTTSPNDGTENNQIDSRMENMMEELTKELKSISANYDFNKETEYETNKNESLITDDNKFCGSGIVESEDHRQIVNYINIDNFKNTVPKVKNKLDKNSVEYCQDQAICEDKFRDDSIASPLSSREDSVKAPTLKCPFCPIRCENTAVMKDHLSTHKDTCKECGKSVSRWNKTRHMRTHAEKHLRCEKCGKSFSDRSYYREHLKTHTTEARLARKDCLCCYCGRKYKWKTSLYRHLHLHVGNSHDCKFCDKKFTNPYYLKMHLVQHTNPERKPFACGQCDAKFTRGYTLAQHARNAHSGRREVYSCPHCNKKFLNKSSLTRHETSKHLSDPKIYECSECGKQFHSRRSMSLHLRVHKTNQTSETEHTLQRTENVETVKFDIEKITVLKVEEYVVNSSVLHLQ